MLHILLTQSKFNARLFVNIIMKKRMGRPKIGIQNAKGELFAARFTPLEAKQIREAIRQAGQSNSDWIRKALLSAAGGSKSGS